MSDTRTNRTVDMGKWGHDIAKPSLDRERILAITKHRARHYSNTNTYAFTEATLIDFVKAVEKEIWG